MDPLPPPPSRADPKNFADEGDLFLSRLPRFQDQANALALLMNDNTITVVGLTSATVALSTANYKGQWSSLSGPLAPPACAYFGGSFWVLNVALANVLASQPGAGTDWSKIPGTLDGTGAYGVWPIDIEGRAAATEVLLGRVEIALKTALQLIYPVGSIYTNAVVETNPFDLIGFGTWVVFGSGRVLVGVNPADAAFDTLGGTGGHADAVVVSHTHTTSVTETPHSHTFSANSGSFNGSDAPLGWGRQGGSTHSTSPASAGVSVAISGTGVAGTNANLQPYCVVHMWVRTA